MTPAASEPAEVRLSARASQLLRGPRALTVLAQLSGDAFFDGLRAAVPRPTSASQTLVLGVPETSHDQQARAAPVLERVEVAAVSDLIVQQGPVLDDAARLVERVLAITSGWAWYPAVLSVRQLLLSGATRYEVAAEQLSRASGAAWWWSDADRGAQVMLTATATPPDVRELARRCEESLEDRSWHLPLGVVTSTALPGLPATALANPDCVIPGGTVHCWKAHLPGSTRIYDVHAPSDWIRLCEEHPRATALPDDWRRWGIDAPFALWPDWRSAATEWDAIHISMAGLLTTVGLPIGQGLHAVLLEGEIDTEFTTWLHPRFDGFSLVAVRSTDTDS